MDTILSSIKKLLGLIEDYDQFDVDILIYINSAISSLTQIGVGPTEGFIVDSMTTWSDYLGNNSKLELVKTYIYLKTKLLFDPPMSSSVTEIINTQLKEYEWRINFEVDK